VWINVELVPILCELSAVYFLIPDTEVDALLKEPNRVSDRIFFNAFSSTSVSVLPAVASGMLVPSFMSAFSNAPLILHHRQCYTLIMEERIIVNPDIRFGKPTIRGTRIAVADILNLLGAGYAINEIPEQYEGVTKEDVIAAIEYASGVLENPAKILARFAHA